MEIIDTHTHLYDKQLVDQLREILQRAEDVGVTQTLVIGTELENSKAAVAIANDHLSVHAVVGFQPNYCHERTEDDWSELLKLIAAPKVVGVGETGLDRYWKDCPFDIQWRWFERHVELASEHKLPLVVHMRDCEDDIVRFWNEHRSFWPIRGVMHSFTGTWETAQTCLAAGLHISFAGMLTYKNSKDIRDVAAKVPADRLLVETDSPYLSPEPFRGKRPNEPARVVHTAECLARTRAVSLEEIATLTTENAKALFRLN